ncbi:hypothetical protein C8R43DRAFT_1138328 [Mycena crocata]|nr:hypothetical protein C8R43DRAFT_1138328 [Mycena crocata]
MSDTCPDDPENVTVYFLGETAYASVRIQYVSSKTRTTSTDPPATLRKVGVENSVERYTVEWTEEQLERFAPHQYPGHHKMLFTPIWISLLALTVTARPTPDPALKFTCDPRSTLADCSHFGFVEDFCGFVAVTPMGPNSTCLECQNIPQANEGCYFSIKNTADVGGNPSRANCEAAFRGLTGACATGGHGEYSEGGMVLKFHVYPEKGECRY